MIENNDEVTDLSSVVSVVNEINDYNEYVNSHQASRKNVWTGVLLPKEYDQLELINYKTE